MAVAVHVNVHAYATTHVATNLVRSLKQLVVACGLDAAKLLGEWNVLELGVETWLRTGHLRELILEIYDPANDKLVKRYDFEIDYGYRPDGDGDLWLDSDAVAYAVNKAGSVLASCSYDVFVDTAYGRPDVEGWSTGMLRSTGDLRRRSVGTAVGGGDLGAKLNYWK